MSLKNINKVANQVSVQRLAEALKYEPLTGGLVWRVRPEGHFDNAHKAARWNGKYAGKPALTSSDPRGYFRGMVDRQMVYAHRVAIALVTGEWPEGEVDHINREKSDNRSENLRVVSHRENRLNSADVERAKLRRLSKPIKPQRLSIPGIRRRGKATWTVRAKRGGEEKHLGSFVCFGAALRARLQA